MKIKEIIDKKNNKIELSFEEISFMVDGFLNNQIDKEKMTDFLKSIYINNMSEKETFNLTTAMLNSGKILNFKNKNKIYADKHSTGGIGDSTTLIIAPIVACAGINFLKMSGSKLGFTGGTVDKLRCFKGYDTEISIAHAEKLLSKNGSVLMSFSEEIAPADKHIYQLRDEKNIIMSIPLISSSIMSKKLADGSDIIVLDVKCGNGAFMKNKKDALALAKSMINTGKMANKKITAVVSDMNQPLGLSVGSLLETIEALEVLKNIDKTSRLRALSVYLSAKIIELGKNIHFDNAIKLVEDILKSGKALSKFKKMIKAQGGSLELFSEKKVSYLLGTPIVLYSQKEGYVSEFNLEKIGYLVREYCSDQNYGIKFLINLGDYIEKNTPMIELYGKETEIDFLSCIHYSKNKKITTNLIIDVL